MLWELLGSRCFFEASASGDLSRRTVPLCPHLRSKIVIPMACCDIFSRRGSFGWSPITFCLSFVPNFSGRIQGAAATLGGATGFSAIFLKGGPKKNQHMNDQVRGVRFSHDVTLKVTDRWDSQIETRCSIDGWLRHAFGWSSFRGRPWCSSPLCIHEGGFFRSCCSKSWFSIPKGRSSFFFWGGKLYTTMDW